MGDRLTFTEKVLVIDDDEGVLESACMALEDMGLDVEVSQGGEELIRQLTEGKLGYSLVLCDVTMPVMSGWDLAEVLRRKMPYAKIFMFTGWLGEECFDPRRKLVNGILLKPLELNILEDIVYDNFCYR